MSETAAATIAAPPATQAAAPAAPADPFAIVPEKYRVKTDSGEYDHAATMAKLANGYVSLEKRLGSGAGAEVPSAYTFTPGEKFNDVKFDDAISAQFQEGARKHGFTQAQYQYVMEQYLEQVPQVLETVARMSADEARTELQKVWGDNAKYEAGLADASRAVANAPESIRQEVFARFGRDPLFIQFAASMGRDMREDSPPSAASAVQFGADADTLMRSPAYRDPKHPEHAAVSARVVELRRKQYGDSPLT